MRKIVNEKESKCPLCKKVVCACDTLPGEKYEIDFLSAEQLKEKVKKNNDLLIINVLPPTYFKDCHIKGSINIPFDQFEQQIQDYDKNKEIVVYCANYMCSASSAAFKILKNHGFKNSYRYKGGMKEWKEKRYPLEGTCSLPYLEPIRKFLPS